MEGTITGFTNYRGILMKKLLITLSILVCCLVISCQPEGTTETGSAIDPAIEEKITNVENNLMRWARIEGQDVQALNIKDRMEFFHVPAVSIAVINNGKIEWAKAYGVKKAGTEESADTETLFQAASISKPVAALGALKLVEEMKIDLDTNVNEYLTSWKLPENEFTKDEPVTLRHLLSHNAGLTVHGFAGYAADTEVPTTRQVLDGEEPANSDAIRADKAPGSGWRYSGGGYTVMQQMIEDVSGMPFSDYMKQHVLDPLGMTRSSYNQPLDSESAKNAAEAHNDQGKPGEGRWHTYPEKAAAGLWTTPSDLAKYMIEIQKTRKGESLKIIDIDLCNEMLTAQVAQHGLGPAVWERDGVQYFSHGGSNWGFKCSFRASVHEGYGFAVMTNGDDGNTLASEIIRSLEKVYGWPTTEQKVKTLVEVDAALLEKYAGTYEKPEWEYVFKVSVADNHLNLLINDSILLPLYPESETDFFSLDHSVAFGFEVAEDGSVPNLLIKSGGQGYPAPRKKD